MNIPVIFEDQWVKVVNKPAGLLTVPTPAAERRTLSSILNGDLAEKSVSYRLYPGHRLDRDTSGLIIYAKGRAIQERVMDLFRARQVQKKYTAFIQGCPVKKRGRISFPVAGKPAVTVYRLSAGYKDFSVAAVYPLTGRTNQIRVHFKAIGNPIVGETKYAFRKDFALRAKRLCLHAAELEFNHPVTGKRLCLSAPLPQDMRDFLVRHR